MNIHGSNQKVTAPGDAGHQESTARCVEVSTEGSKRFGSKNDGKQSPDYAPHDLVSEGPKIYDDIHMNEKTLDDNIELYMNSLWK